MRARAPGANLLCGAILGALGAMSLVEALRIRDEWPGAKLLPAALGVVLALLGLAHLVAPGGAPRAWPDRASRRRVAFVLGLLALYVAGLPVLGFLPATAFFVVILLRALGAYPWTITIALAVAIALASHVVFKHWLGMPLP